ncbi:MAG: hypothetical protein A3F95_02755 [Candidatus Nealsonbacteria bacterium RIFCSPLOWO2_12_FULL_39_31]|uniref:Polymerase beta nucleotidyltransferase domain-containing protein n=3 Tax=Parcubacteria group TaxID=1794811 RepID=A0A1F6FMC4_9BACT|nr:MAG: polymerase beta domain protein region protein [Parcubacteria group bacterium GW2011_GWA2_38_27]KKQ97124.1 MAG: polymerase beta domain protein region protein [Parcubacteria group bacterium GW2011_GWC2_39_11]OGG87013.1 MAG: hypothetical protein A3B87_03520 [Candidatus Kuenenbacteria bacterium RIFCSPHIGHO2_02_FULL_39_13]OGZ20208.1 MAG: hypothetical protein A2626_00300 [Candidatus Nealsonbacteria bacterium RIFCSPHIGHO2_01_FULL_38_55]OGZ22443.1 MAG: hypothetical protein A3E18_03080 [Candidat
MKLEHYPEKKLKKEILEIVGKRLDLKKYKVFFFGSRVSGDNFPKSDIDIGIEGLNPIPFETISEIKEKIDNLPILYRIDIIDFQNVDKDFYEVAKQHIEAIN